MPWGLVNAAPVNVDSGAYVVPSDTLVVGERHCFGLGIGGWVTLVVGLVWMVRLRLCPEVGVVAANWKERAKKCSK